MAAEVGFSGEVSGPRGDKCGEENNRILSASFRRSEAPSEAPSETGFASLVLPASPGVLARSDARGRIPQAY